MSATVLTLTACSPFSIRSDPAWLDRAGISTGMRWRPGLWLKIQTDPLPTILFGKQIIYYDGEQSNDFDRRTCN